MDRIGCVNALSLKSKCHVILLLQYNHKESPEYEIHQYEAYVRTCSNAYNFNSLHLGT